MIRTLLPPFLIVILFYGYTGILGTNHLVLDITTFVIAVVAGEFTGHAAMHRRTITGLHGLAALVLVIAAVAFSTLTFRPPAWFLFADPKSRAHGGEVTSPGG